MDGSDTTSGKRRRARETKGREGGEARDRWAREDVEGGPIGRIRGVSTTRVGLGAATVGSGRRGGGRRFTMDGRYLGGGMAWHSTVLLALHCKGKVSTSD